MNRNVFSDLGKFIDIHILTSCRSSCRTDDLWFVISEISGGPFETLKEFHVEPNSSLDIPISFKPKTLGKHEVTLFLYFLFVLYYKI